MSKKSKTKSKLSTVAETPAYSAPAPLEPSRTLGLLVLLMLIIFTSVWLTRESIESRSSERAVAETMVDQQSLDGFDQEAWFLPDDNAWGFVEIPAGSFTMGSNPAIDSMAYGNEQWSRRQRQGNVELPLYYISRYETTVAQFKAYLADTEKSSEALNLGVAGNFPIAGVTWSEALAYARWLEQKLRQSAETPTELKAFLDAGAHITLPSEAEWEKAARGTDNKVFPWGSRVRTDLANYNSGAPLIVGALPCPACSYGISDMSGNLWELTRSPLQDYPYTTEDDEAELDADALWVMRGGSYADQVNNVRAAVRGGVDPSVRNLTIGFRLVISAL
ncbi:MAG: formylglycine-generating enzyme family protein [Pseudohongiellaceae bacterium]